jgi:ribosomal protein S18 acetylase RimI-like enzyme
LTMTETVMVRTCRPEDASALIALGIKTFYETFAEVNTPDNMRLYIDSTFTLERIEAEFKEPGSQFFIAEENGLSLGYARVRTSKKEKDVQGLNPMEIERIYVLKDQLGKGIGQKLMQACLDFAIAKGHDSIWLGVWEHNDRAIAFYRKWDFEKFSQHTFMLGDDAQIDWLMQKQI